MKKMCQYYDGCPCDKTGHSFYHCPKNTNSKCELIPKKPKTRKIKAWGWISKDGFATACEVERGLKPPAFPCYIIAHEKYLRRK